ncbi:DUF2750 domain-containing protein [uncultured Clostridium sp.]|uniref:DUF2750 domain-containing protein n=1 Tax=uncultured Clostridium sp. TaxID=59620 RepID=UPI0025F302FC|nr:DUF2750 domain-containing protein [uncultured Clostridium sp.]
MNNKEFEAVIKLSASKRYEYFIKKVVDEEEVWGLYDDGWAMTEDDEGNKMIPFWHKREFAKFCAIDEWSGYIPECIDLYKFIDNWLIDMKNDKIKPSIFWNNEDSVLIDIENLINDLECELENY